MPPNADDKMIRLQANACKAIRCSFNGANATRICSGITHVGVGDRTNAGSTHPQSDESVDESGFEVGVVSLIPLSLFVCALLYFGDSSVPIGGKQHGVR